MKKFKERIKRWKPLHLCWLFERLGLPIPKYFIGGAAGVPILAGSRIANATRTWQADEDIDVVDWDKANPFIFAIAIETEAGKKCLKTVSIRWRNKTDGGDFIALSGSGELTWAGVTDLENDNPLIEGEAGCLPSSGQTWQDGVEREGANDVVFDTGNNSNYWSEYHWAIDCSGAHDGDEYEFEIYSISNGIPVSTCAATIKMAAGVEDRDIDKLDAVSLGESVLALVGACVISLLSAVSLGEAHAVNIEPPNVLASEAVSVDEASSAKLDFNPSISEAVGVGESHTIKVSDLGIDVSDSATPGESHQVETGVVVYDSAYLAEIVNILIDLNPDISEAVSSGEATDLDIPIEGSAADAVSVGESSEVEVEGGEPNISVLDSAIPDEVVETKVSDLDILRSDSATPSEDSNVSVPGEPVDIFVSDAVPVKERITNIWQISVHVGEEVNVEIEAPTGDRDINVSDSATPSESVQVETGVVVYDSAYLDEVINVLIDFNPNILEAVSVGESHDVDVPELPASVLDSATPSEAIEVLVSDPDISVSDAPSLAEDSKVTIGEEPYISVIDSALPSEAIEAKVSDLDALTSDSVSLGEAISVLLEILISKLEAISVDEAVEATISDPEALALDSVSLGEAVSILVEILISELEAVSPGEVIEVRISDLFAEVLDSVSVGESHTVAVEGADPNIFVQDSATPNEEVEAKISDLNASVSDLISLDEAISVLIEFLISKLEIVSVGEAVETEVPDIPVSVADSAIPSESHSVELLVKVSESDAVSVAESHEVELDALEVSILEAVSPAEVLALALDDLEISELEAVSPVDSIEVTLPDLEISELEAIPVAEALEAALDDLEISKSDAISLGEYVEVWRGAGLTTNVSDSVPLGEDSNVYVHPASLNISVLDSVTPQEAVDILLLMALSPIQSVGKLEEKFDLKGKLENKYIMKGEV